MGARIISERLSYKLRTMEMPFMSPPNFAAGLSIPPDPAAAPGDWFIFQGDRLLVEMGPPNPAPDEESPRMADIRPLPLPLPSFGQSITSGSVATAGRLRGRLRRRRNGDFTQPPTIGRAPGFRTGPRRWYAPLE